MHTGALRDFDCRESLLGFRKHKVIFYYTSIKTKKTKKKSNGVGEHFSTAILAKLNENPVELVRFAQKL